MLVLWVSFLVWTQTEGAVVSMSVDELNHGKGFKLSCDFKSLRPQQNAQMWKDHRQAEVQNSMALLNITASVSSVTLVLSINAATKDHSGNYSCRTHPPDTISPSVAISIADNPANPSSPSCSCSHHHNGAAGLWKQSWCWILLGKATILLLSLAAFTIKKRTGEEENLDKSP